MSEPVSDMQYVNIEPVGMDPDFMDPNAQIEVQGSTHTRAVRFQLAVLSLFFDTTQHNTTQQTPVTADPTTLAA